MSFFGFDTTLDRDTHKLSQDEDLAVYTFGEEGYDDLAAQLDEGLDELNDETFGDTGALSKDFDYSSQALPDAGLPTRAPPAAARPVQQNPMQESAYSTLPTPSAREQQPPIESIWSSLPPTRPSGDHAGSNAFGNGLAQHAPPSSTFASFETAPLPAAQGRQPSRIMTLEEVEAEQRAAAQLARMSLSNQAQGTPQLSSGLPAGRIDHASGYEQSPVMAQAMPSSGDLELLRLAQQQHQQQQARQMFAQQHQQRQQDLFDQQRQHQQPPQARAQPSDFQRPLQHRPPQGSLPSPQLQQQMQHQTPPPRFAQQQQPQPPHSTNELLTRMQIMESLGGQPLGLDQVNHIDPNAHSLPQEEREALMAQAMNKIFEAERMEEKRRRRLQKIAKMSKYNDLMTQSDKDFITRIQVSQLVTQDPYAEDFYAQVFGAINQQRGAQQRGHQKVLSFGDGGGIGVVQHNDRRSGRRENALNRMQTQIERIVNNSKKRETSSQANLQGALGKVSGRSYKAAPRQLLQVETSAEVREDAAAAAAKEGRDALAGAAAEHLVPQQALSKRQSLIAIEGLYDLVLSIEQLRREQPRQDDDIAAAQWMERYNALADKLWVDSKIMAPLETSNPHPFISLLEPAKGKRLLPRLLRHIDTKRSNLFFTLLVACFRQLDVVRMAPLLDQPEASSAKREAEIQTEIFAATVMPACEAILRRVPIRFVTGILGLLLDAGDVLLLTQTQPGTLLLTLILNRVTELKAVAVSENEPIDPQELDQWLLMVEHLGQFIFGQLSSLFPSSRLAAHLPPGANYYVRQPLDAELNDTATWQFLANFAINTTTHQQQLLVTELREKILENVVSVTKGWVADEVLQQAKMRNVNIFLNALGLDASQITL